MKFAKNINELADEAQLRSVHCKARASMTAQSFERLVAGLNRNDSTTVETERQRLNTYYAVWDGSDACKKMQVDGDTAVVWARQLVTKESLFDESAEWMGQVSPDGGGFTDVQTSRSAKKRFSIEIKAQLTKAGLGEVTQADYLTGYSDFLGHYLEFDKYFGDLVKTGYPDHHRKLTARSAMPTGWNIWDLLLAELLGLYDEDHLDAASVKSTTELHEFARTHYLMHLVGRLPDGRPNQGGARLIRFDSFGLVRHLMDGKVPNVDVRENKSAVRVSFGRADKTEYTIHVGYRLQAVSKSKLHLAFFDDCGGHHVH